MSKDIRDAFFDEICEYALRDENVVVITDDIDIFSLRNFKKKCPSRFINPGVAEQQIINLAAGLASAGKKIVVCGIASFITFRCFEQIKVNICSMNLPVVIVGLGIGLSFEIDGATHHAIQDISVMRAIPELEIYNPSDTYSAKQCAKIAYQSQVPIYVRLDKGIFPDIYSQTNMFQSIKHSNKINIITTGFMTHVVNEIISKLECDIGLLDVFKIKPFNDAIFDRILSSELIFTVEEHVGTGGLYSIVLESLNKNNVKIPVKGIFLEDGQYYQYGSRKFLQSQHGLSRERIINEIRLAGVI